MPIVSVREAAKRMDCTVTQVYRLLDAGYLHGYRAETRRYVDSTSLDDYIATHTRDGTVDTGVAYARLVAQLKTQK